MKDFERILPEIKRVASIYSIRSNRRYSVNELVNEVYVAGYWKTCPENLISRRAHYDIKDYLRKCIGGRQTSMDEKLSQAKFAAATPLPLSMFDTTGDSTIESKPTLANLLSYCDAPSPYEELEQFNYLIDECSEREQIMLRMYFLEDMTMLEIAEYFHRSQSLICVILNGIYDRIKLRLKRDKHRHLVSNLL